MRCRICEISHRNTNRYETWTRYQVCRGCYFILEIFSWNTNYLDKYWRNEK